MKNDPSAYIIRFYQALFGLALVGAGFLCLRGLMYGNTSNIVLLAGTIIGITIVLALGKRYWILFPLLVTSGLRIPGLPFSAGELGCLAVIGTYFIRTATGQDTRIRHPIVTLAAVPYMIWILVVWSQNPTDLNIMGGTTIGGRRYFQIVLGFIMLNVLSRIRFTEKDCKIVLWGMVLFTPIDIVILHYTGGYTTRDGDYATAYFLDPMIQPYLLLMCLYPLRHFVALSWKSVAVMVCTFLIIMSGRRSNFGQVLLTPLLLMVLRRREKMFTMMCATIAGIILALIILGQGNLYELPLPAQRALGSFMPGKWDARLAGYGKKDPFRAAMIAEAKRRIKEDPWFGNGGYAIDRQDLVWAVTTSKAELAGHIAGRNWHNKWYGMAADFGIPLPIAWGFFAVMAALYAFRHTRQTWKGGYVNALLLYYAMYMFTDLIFAGGDATTPFFQWPKFAMVVGLARASEQKAYENDMDIGKETETNIIT